MQQKSKEKYHFNCQTGKLCTVVKMLPPLKEGFIILTALLQQMLYVYNPPNVIETHGCFNQSKEDCKWIKFNQSYLYNDELISVSIFNTSQVHQTRRYKLRFTFTDDSCAESAWIRGKPSEVIIGTSDIIAYMSSGFFLANALTCLVYCLVKCKIHMKNFNFEMYSMFKK